MAVVLPLPTLWAFFAHGIDARVCYMPPRAAVEPSRLNEVAKHGLESGLSLRKYHRQGAVCSVLITRCG